jgi:hypothetical protein
MAISSRTLTTAAARAAKAAAAASKAAAEAEAAARDAAKAQDFETLIGGKEPTVSAGGGVPPDWRNRPVVTTRIGAAILGCSEATIYRLHHHGELQLVRGVHGRTLVRVPDILTILDRNVVLTEATRSKRYRGQGRHLRRIEQARAETEGAPAAV